MSEETRRHGTIPTPSQAVIAAILVAAVVGWAVWQLRNVPFDSDEANHANLALRQFQDLRDGRLMDFLRHSYRTGQFPFLHGWTVVPFFAALGQDEFAARIAQLPWLILGAGATAFAAARLAGDDKRAGGFAGALFALSPVLAAHAGLCMVETTGAAFTALSLAVFGEASRAEEGTRRARSLDVFAALAALAVYFVKHNFGMVAIGASGVGYLYLAARRDTRRRGLVGLAIYVGVLAVVLAAWYASPAQRAAFHGMLSNPADALVRDDPTVPVPGFLPEVFAYYPVELSKRGHLHWAVGAAVFALFAWGAVRAVRARDALGIAAIACFVATWLGLSTGIRGYAEVRFAAAALPALWIVAGLGAESLLAALDARRWGRWVVGIALAAGIAAQSLTIQDRIAADLERDDAGRRFFEEVAKMLPPGSDVLVVNYDDTTSARTLEWRLGSLPDRAFRDHVVKGLIAEKPYESDRELDQWMTDPRPWGDDSWHSYVLEIVPGPTHKLVVPETVERWQRGLARYADRLALQSRNAFPEIDVTVFLRKDLSPPKHVGLGGPR